MSDWKSIVPHRMLSVCRGCQYLVTGYVGGRAGCSLAKGIIACLTFKNYDSCPVPNNCPREMETVVMGQLGKDK